MIKQNGLYDMGGWRETLSEGVKKMLATHRLQISSYRYCNSCIAYDISRRLMMWHSSDSQGKLPRPLPALEMKLTTFSFGLTELNTPNVFPAVVPMLLIIRRIPKMMTSPNLVHTTAKLAYRISELATLIGVSADFIRLRIKSGELKAHKVGWIVLILKENADAWLHSHPIGPDDDDDLQSEESREV